MALNKQVLPADMVERLGRIVAEESDEYASEAADAIERGERPDLWDREVTVPVAWIAEAAALITSLEAENARLREERDGAKSMSLKHHGRAETYLNAAIGWERRADAAEARISVLTEAVDAIADTDELDAALDPTRLIRIAGAARRTALNPKGVSDNG